jgi:hypothetical protein
VFSSAWQRVEPFSFPFLFCPGSSPRPDAAPACSCLADVVYQMRAALVLFLVVVALGQRPRKSVHALFGSSPLPPITDEELAEGAQAAADDLDNNLESESGYGLLMQAYKQEMAGQLSSTGRRLLGVPSPALSNSALENLASRIIKVLAGNVMKAPGTMGCGVAICGMSGRSHEGIMYPPGLCRVSRPTACVSWGLSTSNKHRGSDFLHEVLHAYTLRLQQQGKAGWHFQRYQVFDEHFNDCLTQLMGGSYLNYG